MAKRKPRWAVVYEKSRTGWASFCVRGSNAFEAQQAAKKDARLERGKRFSVRKL